MLDSSPLLWQERIVSVHENTKSLLWYLSLLSEAKLESAGGVGRVMKQ